MRISLATNEIAVQRKNRRGLIQLVVRSYVLAKGLGGTATMNIIVDRLMRVNLCLALKFF